MANNIELITKYAHTELDKLLVKEATSGILEIARPGKLNLEFVGAKLVKIPSITMDALSDYSRVDGYPAGAVNLEWETLTLTMDRGKQFRVDAMDNEESAGIIVANLLKEFARAHVIPEVDAFRFSSIAAKAAKTVAEDITAGEVIAKFADIEKHFEDNEVDPTRVIYFISTEVSRLIKTTPELARLVDTVDVVDGDIKLKVKTFNDCPIVVVPPKRFKTAYTFGEDGFTAAVDAKDINILAVYDAASIPVKKHNPIRVFTPEQVQDADGYKFNYRLYHDIFVPKNKTVGVYLSHKV